MRLLKIFIIVSVLLLPFSEKLYSQKVDKGLRQITPELIKEYVDFLASDSLKGRDTPSKELDIAADYIAAQFEKFKLQKVGGSYFQEIPFCTKKLDISNCILRISGGEGADGKRGCTFQLKTDYIPFGVSSEMNPNRSVDAEIVFVGYGITAPEYNYDDYSGVDVKGKIVLMLKHEPGERDTASLFMGTDETEHSLMMHKVENAREHGAVGVMLVTDPLNHIMLAPQGYPWPDLYNFIPQDNTPLCVDFSDSAAIPVVQIGEGVIAHLFGSVDSLKHIQMGIDESLKPNSFSIKGRHCLLSVKVIYERRLSAKNVVGYIKGTDKNLADELLVIGGHYDHVGIERTHKEGEDYIFNGADDNASGTAGVMSIAKAFSSAKQKPERSILFILFAGEESGLYGSKFYSSHPLLPLDKTVAMINMDMISRNGEDTLQIEGANLNPDLAAIILKENEKVGLKYVPTGDEFFGRSDHYNFFKKGITAVDITGGLHKDYHTVYDNPDRIDNKKAARISQLVYRTAQVIANDGKRYKIIEKRSSN